MPVKCYICFSQNTKTHTIQDTYHETPQPPRLHPLWPHHSQSSPRTRARGKSFVHSNKRASQVLTTLLRPTTCKQMRVVINVSRRGNVATRNLDTLNACLANEGVWRFGNESGRGLGVFEGVGHGDKTGTGHHGERLVLKHWPSARTKNNAWCHHEVVSLEAWPPFISRLDSYICRFIV